MHVSCSIVKEFLWMLHIRSCILPIGCCLSSYFLIDMAPQRNQDEEQGRIDKELANIRKKFRVGTGLNSYSRKKYVWKLVYIFMLGYDVDFGHNEILLLLSSPKYSEKNVGYIAAGMLIHHGDEAMPTVVNTVKNDLVGRR